MDRALILMAMGMFLLAKDEVAEHMEENEEFSEKRL
jgi:hypothetical protein